MRASIFIVAMVIVVSAPAHAEPQIAPVIVEPRRVEGEPQLSLVESLASGILGERSQSTVADREPEDEVWSDDAGTATEIVTTPCKLCRPVSPARRINLPPPTAPRN